MKVLVYIPCHSDFEIALNQVKKVRESFDRFKHKPNGHNINIEIIVSVNAYLPTNSEKELAEQICEKVIYNGAGLLADINIANGYLVALNEKPDILWLLSTNDDLVENAVENILNEFVEDNTIDLLVTSLELNQTFIEKQIIDPGRTGFSYGLISGVVYRLERLFPYLHNGPFMAWTGWSQLAVMQSAMDGLDGLKVKAIPFELVYQQRERDLISAGRHYAHSIYGMLILGIILKPSNYAARKYIRKYVLNNFYAWHLFSREWKYTGQLITGENYLAWNQKIAESLIYKSSPLTFIFYKFAKLIPFEKLSQIKSIIFIKRKFDKMLGQSKHYKS
jgi:hypothetical protein